MNSFFGGRKIGEKVTKVLAAGTSFARRIRARASINWPRVSLSTNTEQEDVGDLEVGGEIEVNNSTMLENQNVVQVVVTGAPPDASAVAAILPNNEDFGYQDDIEEENQDDLEEGNQDHIQGGDPDDVVVEHTKLAYGNLKLYRLVMALNVGILVLLIQYSDIAPLKRDLIRVVSIVLSVVHAVSVVLVLRWDAFLWTDILLLTGQVLVTTANFA